VGGQPDDSNWQIRVLPNKYPFAPIHEIIIHSPDHHKNFGELSENQTKMVFETYRQRFQTHSNQGQVYIFHNRGEQAGESLIHPHSQLAVIPNEVKLDIPPLDTFDRSNSFGTLYFDIFCPSTSEWPDECWIAPASSKFKVESSKFGDASDEEIKELSQIITKLVQVFQKKYGAEFPYNFYLYTGKNWPASNASQSDAGWYLRFIPRVRHLGGFEVGTNVSVNTQDPKETLKFIKDHFENPDIEEIKKNYQASYKKAV